MVKWKSRWVNNHPQVVTLKDWSVYDVDDGNRHVVGYVVEHDSRRVSTPIEILYGTALEAVAQPGYRYILAGGPGPGEEEDPAGTWIRHSMVQNTGVSTDVTKAVWRKYTQARLKSPADVQGAANRGEEKPPAPFGLADARPDFAGLWNSSPGERCSMIDAGLPLSIVPRLAESMGVTQVQLTEWLSISAEFFSRQTRIQGVLPPTPSERVLGLGRLVGQVETIVHGSGDPKDFDGPRWMAAWLGQPTPVLGNRRPSEFLSLSDGREMLSQLLGQMQSGAFS